jgi:hypothetical protein
MKNIFKFDRTKNQYYTKFNNRWFYFDKDEFNKMNNDDIEKVLSATQKSKYVSDEELKQGFDNVRDFIKRSDKNVSFRDFLKSRSL